MGILDALWKSYQSWQEEKEVNSDYEEYEPSYPERPQSSLPKGYCRIFWKGYYMDYGNQMRECRGVEAVCERGLANRICNNVDNAAVYWLRKAIPDFCEAATNGGPFPWCIEENR